MEGGVCRRVHLVAVNVAAQLELHAGWTITMYRMWIGLQWPIRSRPLPQFCMVCGMGAAWMGFLKVMLGGVAVFVPFVAYRYHQAFNFISASRTVFIRCREN
jgi:hypothetical protein